MKRFSRLYEQTAEFRDRCLAFDFAIIAHAVLDVALHVKKSLSGWWNKVRPKVQKPQSRRPHQLVLELDGIAQITLFA